MTPHGTQVGEAVIDVPFTDCDGAPLHLHDSCGAPTVVLNFYGWCGPCLEHVHLVEELAGSHPRLGGLVVATEDGLGAPADAGLCALLQEAYPGLTLAIDPDALLAEAHGGPGLVMVLDATGTIALTRTDAIEQVVRDAVDAVLHPE
jgi:hypothetical protein